MTFVHVGKKIGMEIKQLELGRPEICHLVGVREDGKQSDESIFRKIGVFNRLKIS
jgi:hypothetical protein